MGSNPKLSSGIVNSRDSKAMAYASFQTDFLWYPRAPSISGDCTYAVPLKMRLVDTNSLDVYLLIRIWDDVDGTKLLDVG